MAARSVTINFTNNTDVALVGKETGLDHGEWGTNPPGRIEPHSTVTWEAESDGVATGTEGHVDYSLDLGVGATGVVHVYFDNPFVGSNSYDQSAPEAYMIVRNGDGSGDDSTATWVLSDASSTGDGIPDDWKRNGVTIDPGDGSGPQFIDLPSMGATVAKPDIFVQLDWMADATHSHAPSSAAIQQVVDAFANAPYISRNGSVGINLHVDAGPDSIMDFATGTTWGALSRAANVGHVNQLGTSTNDSAGNATSYDWTEFDKLKNRSGGFTSTGRTKIFRYAISAHQLGSAGNSGIARSLPGSDLIVALGTFTGITDTNFAGTIMHELGHLLGLDHGGGDAVNFKPNYVSVMSYAWQFSGVTRGAVTAIDYSNGALVALDETALNETSGLGPGSAGVAIKHWVPARGATPGAFVQVNDASGPIDWDGDGLSTSTSVSVDTNNDSATNTLAPYDDWLNLKLKGGAVGSSGYAPPTVSSSPPELTPRVLSTILPEDTTAPVTSATVFPAPNAAGWNRTDVAVTLTAIDDVSGVARTDYSLDGLGRVQYLTPVAITAEGVHDLAFSSIDRSQNRETDNDLTVRIDKTAPELVITYDAEADDIVVAGRDSLSGTPTGPQAPARRVDTEWTDFGSDTAELRWYRIADAAGNTTTTVLKVRCSPVAWEASVLGVHYDDEAHANGNQSDDHETVRLFDAYRGHVFHERNTMVFTRLTARTATAQLLGVRQVVAVGAGDARSIVRARYDVLDDYTILGHDRPRPVVTRAARTTATPWAARATREAW